MDWFIIGTIFKRTPHDLHGNIGLVSGSDFLKKTNPLRYGPKYQPGHRKSIGKPYGNDMKLKKKAECDTRIQLTTLRSNSALQLPRLE